MEATPPSALGAPVIHPTADVSPEATIGAGTVIWHRAQIRERARIGEECIIGKDVYIDHGVVLGSRVKVQNSALIYHGATLEDGVFVGPQVVIANDPLPRAITPEGKLKRAEDWEVGEVRVLYGASLGAGSLILPGVTIGRFAMVGAGAVVTRKCPDYGILMGDPARHLGYACPRGHRLGREAKRYRCAECDWTLEAPEGTPESVWVGPSSSSRRG
jgi:acetyltransferase-like isoleucine patch superfamily enzyme